MIRVGVDVGGTFTDIVLERTRAGSEGEQEVIVTKVPSTPHDQSEGVVAGILQVCSRAGVDPGSIDVLFHGTTVATNMVIERNGAEVGMLTTRGFRDIMHMARHKRPHKVIVEMMRVCLRSHRRSPAQLERCRRKRALSHAYARCVCTFCDMKSNELTDSEECHFSGPFTRFF